MRQQTMRLQFTRLQTTRLQATKPLGLQPTRLQGTKLWDCNPPGCRPPGCKVPNHETANHEVAWDNQPIPKQKLQTGTTMGLLVQGQTSSKLTWQGPPTTSINARCQPTWFAKHSMPWVHSAHKNYSINLMQTGDYWYPVALPFAPTHNRRSGIYCL